MPFGNRVRNHPSDALICKLAKALDGDADELLILAKKVPERIKRRVLERPDAFRKLADLVLAAGKGACGGPGRDRGVSLQPANGEVAVQDVQVQVMKGHD
jgi:hypothetical protein